MPRKKKKPAPDMTTDEAVKALFPRNAALARDPGLHSRARLVLHPAPRGPAVCPAARRSPAPLVRAVPVLGGHEVRRRPVDLAAPAPVHLGAGHAAVRSGAPRARRS